MPYFDGAGGVRLHHEDWGQGPPLVFVSGWGLSGDMWQYQMIALTDHGFRAITYDRRGHGRSERPASGFDYDTLSDDLAALLATLGLSGVTLVAHSMGEGEVVRYLSRHAAAWAWAARS